MSRLTKKSIHVPEGVTILMDGKSAIVKGPKGEVRVAVESGATFKVEGAELRATTGTLWSLLRNAIQGVTEGFNKVLIIEGVGYRAVLEGKDLVLHLGYAHPVRFAVPEGISMTIEKNMIKASGIDKDLIGRTMAEIRSMKKPEPYKGKGIHYEGEVIRRKVGKKAAATVSS